MKRTGQILILLLLGITSINVLADEKDKDKKKIPKPKPIPVYLGNSNIDSGMVGKQVFDSLVRQGFTSRDSNGRVFDVNSFMFTFCERNLYEDSVGNPLILTDYLSEFSFSNKFKDYQLEALLERAKWGDTVIIEKLVLTSADSARSPANGKPLKLIISR